MSEDKPEPENDAALFRQAMADVQPLAQDKIKPQHRHAKRAKATKVPVRTRLGASLLGEAGPDSQYWQPADGETFLSYQGSGLQHRQFRKLKQGQTQPQARLDLHGLRLAQGEQAINRFIADAQREGLRCVVIVHGKGNPNKHQGLGMKSGVNHWLREDARVVGFCSAPAHMGGRGAVLVLIRR